MATSPSATLYINNLNDKINKLELRQQLFSLFTTYGKVIDIIAQKGPKMRGQAFLVFADLAEATAAMRACDGFIFYDKPMRVQYAKTKSYATLRREDPDFVPPNPVASQVNQKTDVSLSNTEKRSRDDNEDASDARDSKRERTGRDDDDEEMEMDDEDDSTRRAPAQEQRTARLLCTNLPQEVTDGVLSVLFQQYQGFLSTHVTQSPTPNSTGVKTKMAHVVYETPELASVAKEALDGFTLKKGWKMAVTYT